MITTEEAITIVEVEDIEPLSPKSSETDVVIEVMVI